MRWIYALVLASGLAGCSLPPPPLASVQEGQDWMTKYEAAADPLYAYSPAFPEDGDEAARQAWAASAHAFVAGMPPLIAKGRQDAAALPDPPSVSLEAHTRMAAVKAGLPGAINAEAEYVARFEKMIDTMAKGGPEANKLARLIHGEERARLLAYTRDINFAVAAMLSDGGPERHILRSLSASYDGVVALLEARRAWLTGAPSPTAKPLAVLRESVKTMRAAIRSGRSAQAEKARLIPQDWTATQAQRDAALELENTYVPSFDREEIIAADFERLIAILEATSSYADVAEPVEAFFTRFSARDVERAADMAKRGEIAKRI